jgi:cell wall-associated NlpC family hydrolase
MIPENLMPGDLIFVHGVRGHYSPRYPQGIGHVGMYIGNNTVIHAASRRVSEYPHVAEEGKVEEIALSVFIERLKPLVVVKRW